MLPVKRRDDPYLLVVGMAGVKMGDRIVQIGCAHGGRLAAIAAKVGLSGRAVAVVPDEASASRASRGASGAGVLVEVATAPPTSLPLEAEAFDLAIVDDTAGLLASASADERVAIVRQMYRVLRPGGRALVMGAVPRGGLAGLFSRAPAVPRTDAARILEAAGFATARTLAERDGLSFVEAIKPR
jgi:ubiquinone/menaquinone biosynthesis C-methylase UbiE